MSRSTARRIRAALMAYAVLAGGVGFFVLCTYCIVTPGGTGTAFSSWREPVDSAQERWCSLWFLWGLIGGLLTGAFSTFPPLVDASNGESS